jgi:Ni/Co efflux regulator RcnB
MRKVLALLLLAGAATPAIAAADPGDRHGGSHFSQQSTDNHGNRSDDSNRQHSDRGDRGNRGGNDAQPQDHPRAVMRLAPSGGGNNDQVQPVTPVETNNSGGNAGEHRHFNGVRSRTSGGEPRTIEPSGHSDGRPADTVRDWHGPKIVEPPHGTTEDRAAPALREQHRAVPNVFRNRVPVVSRVPREGTQPPLRVDSRSRDRTHQWDTRWRSNHRYDWQDWRRHHRSHFHLGLYFDPFGWNYQPWQIGWRLWPNYYSSRYWISDPFEYRLPYAPPGYRWIRYYDDAILVDTFTGEAVDVIHNFFW